MTDQAYPPNNQNRNRLGLKITLVAAGIAAGAVGATAIGASASTTTSGTAVTAAAASTSSNGRAATPANAHGSAPVRSDEKAVTAAQAATLKAAALKAVPGGTVYRIETDAGDGVYEAHMTKADGTEVTVKFDKNLAVTGVETGMGKGDPAGNH
jgi:uncharacterized membrane protein YkoI